MFCDLVLLSLFFALLLLVLAVLEAPLLLEPPPFVLLLFELAVFEPVLLSLELLLFALPDLELLLVLVLVAEPALLPEVPPDCACLAVLSSPESPSCLRLSTISQVLLRETGLHSRI